MTKAIGGLISAVHTPFFSDYSVNIEGMKQNLNFMIDSGIDGVMVTGTAGEFVNLTKDEKKRIWEASHEVCKNKILLIAHTGDSSTIKALELTNCAKQIGIEYVMIMTPYITKPTQEEIYQHYKYIAENTEAKIVIYNNPGRVGVKIESKTLISLAAIDNIVGVKESSRDLRLIMEVVAATKGMNFSVLSGEVDLVIPILAMGGRGAIITPTIVCPHLFLNIYRSIEKGQWEKANEHQHSILDFLQCLGKGKKYHAAIKACVEMTGRPAGPPRPPLTEISSDEKQELKKFIEKYSG